MLRTLVLGQRDVRDRGRLTATTRRQLLQFSGRVVARRDGLAKTIVLRRALGQIDGRCSPCSIIY